MVQRHLLDERRPILAEVPPLEDQYQAGDQGRGSRESNVELRRERVQEDGSHHLDSGFVVLREVGHRPRLEKTLRAFSCRSFLGCDSARNEELYREQVLHAAVPPQKDRHDRETKSYF